MSRRTHLLLVWGVLLLLPSLAVAQESLPVEGPEYDAPAHLSVVDGTATLSRDGRSETAVVNMPLLEGDRIDTSRGRVEVFFPDGSVLHLDEYSTLDLLSGSQLRLLRGRTIVLAAGRSDARRDFDVQIDTPAGSVRMLMPGQYRISLFSGPEVELAVVRGEAALATSRGSSQARTGERVYAREGETPSYPVAFNSARWDAFEAWSDQQRRASVGSNSVQYLPEEVDQYSYVFDRYGSWREMDDYGWVWYPRVDYAWRPYYSGYWSPFRSWGWFWIGYDPWAWPTHHYGRWGFDGGWYWIPHRRFGPGWVSWGISSLHVSWCPLGWNNRPIISLFVDNHYFGGRAFDPWRAWTVVPRHSFGRAVRASAVAIPGASLDQAVRRSFIVQQSAPPAATAAMARPIGVAGYRGSGPDRAVPRGAPGTAPSGGGGGAYLARPGGSTRPSEPSSSAVPRGGADARPTEPYGSVPEALRRGAVDRGSAPGRAPGERAGEARTRGGEAAVAPDSGAPGIRTPARERDYWSDRRSSGATSGSSGGGGDEAGATPRRSPSIGGLGSGGRTSGGASGTTREPGRATPRGTPPSSRGGRGGQDDGALSSRSYQRPVTPRESPTPRTSERSYSPQISSPSYSSRDSYAPRAMERSYSPRTSSPSYSPRASQPSYSPRASQPSYSPRASQPSYSPRGTDRSMGSRSSSPPSMRSAPSSPSRSSPGRTSGSSSSGGGSRARPRNGRQ